MMEGSVILGVLIPFVGTTLGSAMVFFIKKRMDHRVHGALLGFASGVMIAASIWSLLLPSLELAKDAGGLRWIPAAVGFLAGIGFLLLLDTITPHLHASASKPEGVHASLKKSTMLFLAVTIHNIPEGMAVGVSFAGMLSGNHLISLTSAIALSIGIAIQNFPEGAIISLPMVGGGYSKKKAFLYGTASGVVEPLAAVVTILLTAVVLPLLPYLLSFAAGAMIYVVVEELIPESQAGEHTNWSTVGVAIGFVLMMVLDVMLG